MPEYRLTALYPLGGREPLIETLSGIEIAEIGGRSIVSVASRRGAETRLREAIRTDFGVDLPPPGRIVVGGRVSFAWMAQGQWFADASERAAPDLHTALAAALGDSASLTDQSDAWVRLRLSGPSVRAALGRLCMLDLDEQRFPAGSAARTVMEHLGTVVLRPDAATFELWSARSSACSFAHAIRVAAGRPSTLNAPERHSVSRI